MANEDRIKKELSKAAQEEAVTTTLARTTTEGCNPPPPLAAAPPPRPVTTSGETSSFHPPSSVLVSPGPSSAVVSAISDFDFPPEFLHGQVRYPKITEEDYDDADADAEKEKVIGGGSEMEDDGTMTPPQHRSSMGDASESTIKNRERASMLAAAPSNTSTRKWEPQLEKHNEPPQHQQQQKGGSGGVDKNPGKQGEENLLARSTSEGCHQPTQVEKNSTTTTAKISGGHLDDIRSSHTDVSDNTLKNRERASQLATMGSSSRWTPEVSNVVDNDNSDDPQEAFDATDILQKPTPLPLLPSPSPQQEHNMTDESDIQRQNHRNMSAAIQSSAVSRPGAYSGAPGVGFERSSTLRFSLVGLTQNLLSKRTIKDISSSSQEQDHHNHDNQTYYSYERRRTRGSNSVLLENENNGDDTTTGNNGENLTVAKAIMDESLKHAVPFDPEQQSERRIRETTQPASLKKLWIGLLLFVVVLVATVAIILGWYFSGDASTADDSSTVSLDPTVAPTEASTVGLLEELLLSLPNTTLSLGRFGTPQWKALDWLENHPELSIMEEWRKQQLFALATFFYAMEGPNWKEDIQKEWMQYTENECFWFSTGFGKFDFATGLYVEEEDNNRYNMTPCNRNNEFQLLHLAGLELDGLNPYLPQELELLTSLSVLSLEENQINTPLSDFLPPGIYQMSNLDSLSLAKNHLTGPVPSQVGLMNNLTDLILHSNQLTGEIPSELGVMTLARELFLHTNYLTGTLPVELGQMSALILLELWGNILIGQIPSEFGMLTSIDQIAVDYNELTGSIPTSLGNLRNMSGLWLSVNSLSGTIPQELSDLVGNGSLGTLLLRNNYITGSISEDLCSLGLESDGLNGLSFDCSEQLCGCCWCPCAGTLNTTNDDCPWSLEEPHDPSQDDPKWPGVFPSPINSSNIVTINIHTDGYPEETSWEWSRQLDSGLWDTLDAESLLGANSLFSYTREVESNSIYRLRLSDRLGDGTCCAFGNGWFTITNSTPSAEFTQGTVVWNTSGDNLGKRIDIILEIDSDGSSEVLIVL